jgi:3-deoxy-manno-octulosonate cytidylyltransferase (CMP-KDO synthetase)
MATFIIIPARLKSKRLPGKPLAEIQGVPMVKRVYDQCVKSGIPKIYVASDSDEVLFYIPEKARIKVDGPNCFCGTDRVALAAMKLDISLFDHIINVQGDMPFIDPMLIRAFDKFMNNTKCPVGTVAIPTHIKEHNGYVSVVTDSEGRALYFSRSLLRFSEKMFYRHVGMYGFTYSTLLQFQACKSRLEDVEKLEQLRIVEFCLGKIDVMITSIDPGPEINTRDDYINAQHWGKNFL